MIQKKKNLTKVMILNGHIINSKPNLDHVKLRILMINQFPMTTKY